MRKCKLLFIVFSIALISFSCNNDFEKDETAKIKEAIESSLFEDINNPDSYEFNQIRILDTLYVKDAYKNRVENLRDRANSERSLIQRTRGQIYGQEIPERLSILKEEFRVYGMYDQFDRFKDVLTLYEQNNSLWIDKLNDLENTISESSTQEYRYRKKLPLFEELRTLERSNAVIESATKRVKSIESEIQQLEEFIKSNEEKMSEIAFYRILFSHREENIFGGLQLIRKIYEVRFKNELIDLMWESENFEANEEALKAINNPSYGQSIKIIKQENELL